MDKYHIALSFAGEDREYVEKVANELRDSGVDVFYDKFEETKLWGKNLYSYLSDIYQNKAVYTVMFVSQAYKEKLWTNHERESAQARAFSESKEYILPAKFDNTVEIPGLLSTTGYIDLNNLSPEEFALKIITKLEDDGIKLEIDTKFNYSTEAREDIDFPLIKGDEFSEIIKKLKSSNWYAQNPAIDQFYNMGWGNLSDDQFFIIGRNLYQCACGGERRAVSILENLRKEMAIFPIANAEHIINGMAYEIYFNHEGEFRSFKLKSWFISEIFSILSVKKYESCLTFIKKVLKPYMANLAVFPSKDPEKITLKVSIKKSDNPVVKSVVFNDKELLTEYDETNEAHHKIWKLSFRKFYHDNLIEDLSKAWHIPANLLDINYNKPIPHDSAFKLPENTSIDPPFEAN
jgi:hypothetical protein